MFHQCELVAAGSDDPHRKVGCVIVNSDGKIVASGTNKVPDGITPNEHRVNKPGKYLWIEHAERNAIYSAARQNIPIAGMTMFINWWPCIDCTRAIIQSGIKKIVAPRRPDFEHPRWGPHFRASFEMLEENGSVAMTFEEDYN
jgi:dCMP deaminase